MEPEIRYELHQLGLLDDDEHKRAWDPAWRSGCVAQTFVEDDLDWAAHEAKAAHADRPHITFRVVKITREVVIVHLPEVPEHPHADEPDDRDDLAPFSEATNRA